MTLDVQLMTALIHIVCYKIVVLSFIACHNAAYTGNFLAIFTDPYYLECLYLSQMRKTQLSLLQMGQKGTTFYRMKAGHICLWKRLIDIVGLPIEVQLIVHSMAFINGNSNNDWEGGLRRTDLRYCTIVYSIEP